MMDVPKKYRELKWRMAVIKHQLDIETLLTTTAYFDKHLYHHIWPLSWEEMQALRGRCAGSLALVIVYRTFPKPPFSARVRAHINH